MLQRIVIVGTSGSGKSTLARDLATCLRLSHIELDALHWDADWQAPPHEAFIERVQGAMDNAPVGWTMDGNYSMSQAITWPRADTLIWLDYPRHIVMWRITLRTIRRVFTRQELWNGNRESFRNAFASKDSMILWAYNTYQRNRQRYSAVFTSDHHPHLTMIRFTHPRQTEAWLKALASP
ncbi:MAG: AAA family ATPase [Anaerolineae bacterium]